MGPAGLRFATKLPQNPQILSLSLSESKHIRLGFVPLPPISIPFSQSHRPSSLFPLQILFKRETLLHSDGHHEKLSPEGHVKYVISRNIVEDFSSAFLPMKLLEYTPLERINDFLDHLNLGERTIEGCLEAYSCKHTGTDKRLSFSLEHEILDYLGRSSDTDSSSPADSLLSRSSRKTLIYLVLALYHMYPDYDFSAVKAHQFFTEETWDTFKQIFETYMFEASKEWIEVNGDGSLLEAMYKALDEVVKLSECEIYSYNPNSDADPFAERGAIWSFNFFFYNRKLKRVVSFRFFCLSNLVGDAYLAEEIGYYEDAEIFDNMDM